MQKNLALRRAPQYGWKHGFPVAIGYHPASLIVTVYRDPIDWLISPYHKPRTMGRAASQYFATFIREPFFGNTCSNKVHGWLKGSSATVPDEIPKQPIQADMDPFTGLPFETAMHLRNAKLKALLGIRNRADNVVSTRYEFVRDSRKESVEHIADTYGISQSDKFDPVNEPAQPKRNFAERPRTSREAISKTDMTFILDTLDLSQVQSLGYVYAASS